MDHKNRSNIGDQISDIISNAVNSMDFEQLNKNITKTVNSALEEAKAGMEKTKARTTVNASQSTVTYHTPEKKKENNALVPVSYNPSGNVSGTLLTVFGGVGTGVFGILTLLVAFLAGSVEGAIGVTGFFAVLTAASVGGIIGGISLRRRVKRFKNYVRILGGRPYMTIQEMAQTAHVGEDYLVKDLKKMCALCMFKEGHLDDSNTCFIANNETYHQYLEAKKNMLERQRNEAKEAELNADQRALLDATQKGDMYIAKIREANDAIPGEEISKKLDQLEMLIHKIFEHVKKNPQQLPQIRKFMEYYLPTTLKLVNAYKDFDSQPIQGENIQKSKNEIEKTIDTINTAFENLLNDLYKNTTMDVSSDISVLQSMFAQEGLTNRDFGQL